MKENIILFLAIIIVAISCITSAECQQFVTNGLLGFWTMDRDDIKGNIVKDVSGNNNHGEASGNPKIVQAKIEEAFEFDGTDDFVKLPNFGEEPAVSVEVWAIANKPFPDIRGLVSTFDPPQWKPGSVHFKFEANNIDVLKNGGGRIQVPAEPNKWYHVAYTSDVKNNELKLYVNGELINKTVAGAELNNLTNLRIGSEHEGRYFSGILDEVRIYKRILSEKEISQNYKVTANSLAIIRPYANFSIFWGKIKLSGQ